MCTVCIGMYKNGVREEQMLAFFWHQDRDQSFGGGVDAGPLRADQKDLYFLLEIYGSLPPRSN